MTNEMTEEKVTLQTPVEKATRSESIKELISALSKAQGQMQGAEKKSENPFFKKPYADIASVWETCRQPLSQNGLAVIQTTEPTDDHTVCLITTLAHSSGEFISSKLKMKPVKDDPQGIGSCITYARRYSLMAMVGIAPEDDDGETAMGRDKGKSRQTQLQPPANKDNIKLKDVLNRGNNGDGEKHKVTRTEVGGMLIELTGGKEAAKAKLIELTSFVGENGDTIVGKTSLKDISDKQLLVLYGKVKKLLADKKGDGTINAINSKTKIKPELTDEPDEAFPGGVEVADEPTELTLAQERVAEIPSELLKLARAELKITKAIPELDNETCLALSKRSNIIADRKSS
uniref:Putative Erf family protein n=1 Tax=viral metagenome TaxID=1070528 RepID=A0A6M3XU40_9ZZZZ